MLDSSRRELDESSSAEGGAAGTFGAGSRSFDGAAGAGLGVCIAVGTAGAVGRRRGPTGAADHESSSVIAGGGAGESAGGGGGAGDARGVVTGRCTAGIPSCVASFEGSAFGTGATSGGFAEADGVDGGSGLGPDAGGSGSFGPEGAALGALAGGAGTGAEGREWPGGAACGAARGT